MDIEELIRRGRQGDEAALGNLYQAYHRHMTAICQQFVGNRGIAEELAHDAFLLAFAKMDQLHNPQRFEAWLTSISTNVARRYKQRRHDLSKLSLSTITEEELPQEPIPTDDKPLPTIGGLMDIRSSRETIESFERLISETDYTICQRTLWLINPHYKQKFHLNPRRQWTIFSGIPYLGNYYTTSAWYLLHNK